MEKISLSKIKNSLPSKKKERDKMDIWVFYVIRPISYYFTWLCLKLKISASGATFISMIIGVLGSLLLLSDTFITRIVGAIIINFWIVFDCVDGNIARFKGSSSTFGTFIDGVSGYLFMAVLYLCIGTSAYLYSDPAILENHMWVYLFIGAVGSISTLLPRLIEHKATTMFTGYQSNITNQASYGLFSTIAFNIGGIAGLGLPLLLITYIFDFQHIYILFYGIFHFAVAIYSSVNTISRLQKYSS